MRAAVSAVVATTFIRPRVLFERWGGGVRAKFWERSRRECRLFFSSRTTLWTDHSVPVFAISGLAVNRSVFRPVLLKIQQNNVYEAINNRQLVFERQGPVRPVSFTVPPFRRMVQVSRNVRKGFSMRNSLTSLVSFKTEPFRNMRFCPETIIRLFFLLSVSSYTIFANDSHNVSHTSDPCSLRFRSTRSPSSHSRLTTSVCQSLFVLELFRFRNPVRSVYRNDPSEFTFLSKIISSVP